MKILNDNIEPAPERDAEGHPWCSHDCPACQQPQVRFYMSHLQTCAITGQLVEPDAGLPPRSPCLGLILLGDPRLNVVERAIYILQQHPGNCNHKDQSPFCCDIALKELLDVLGEGK